MLNFILPVITCTIAVLIAPFIKDQTTLVVTSFIIGQLTVGVVLAIQEWYLNYRKKQIDAELEIYRQEQINKINKER
jgi:hypothetical protein